MHSYFYYDKDKVRQGPVSRDEIKDRVQTGDIAESTFIWRNGWSDWQRLRGIDELQDVLDASGTSEDSAEPSPAEPASPAPSGPAKAAATMATRARAPSDSAHVKKSDAAGKPVERALNAATKAAKPSAGEESSTEGKPSPATRTSRTLSRSSPGQVKTRPAARRSMCKPAPPKDDPASSPEGAKPRAARAPSAASGGDAAVTQTKEPAKTKDNSAPLAELLAKKVTISDTAKRASTQRSPAAAGRSARSQRYSVVPGLAFVTVLKAAAKFKQSIKLIGRRNFKLQKIALTNWANFHLKAHGTTINDLETDLGDGLALISLLEILSGKTMFKHKDPKSMLYQLDNLNIVLKYIRKCGIPLNKALDKVTPEDIIDGNLIIILELLWTMVKAFQLKSLSTDEDEAKEALLLWVQDNLKNYGNISVRNLDQGFRDGMAFSALLHQMNPALIDIEKLDKKNRLENVANAFDIAEQEFGIPRICKASEFVKADVIDARAVITYLSFCHRCFSTIVGGTDSKGYNGLRRRARLCEVRLASVPQGTKAEDLFAQFSSHGEVTGCSVAEDGSATVRFRSAREALSAATSDESVTEIHLQKVALDKDCVGQLEKAIATNMSLKGVYVNENGLTRDQASRIVRAVGESRRVSHFAIERNSAGDAGAQALADALRKNGRLKDVSMAENGITAAGAEPLGVAVATAPVLERLDLSGNRLGVAGARALAHGLEHSASLREVLLGGNRLGAEGVSAIAEALMVNRKIERVDLSYNAIGDSGADAVASLIRSAGITSVNVAGNKIGASGSRALAEALGENESLRELLLDENEIDNDGARALAGAIGRHRGLTRVGVSANGFTDEGLDALQESLDVNAKVAVDAGARASTLMLRLARVDPGASASDIADDMSRYGPVTDVVPLPSSNGAYVRFGTLQAAIEALQGRQNVEELRIEGQRVSQSDARALAAAIAGAGSLARVRIANNEWDEGALAIVLESLAKCSGLSDVDLSGNAMTDAEAEAVKRILASASALQTVNLSANGVSDDAIAEIVHALPPTKTVDLSDTASASATANALAARLEDDARVFERVLLRGCALCDDDVDALASAGSSCVVDTSGCAAVSDAASEALRSAQGRSAGGGDGVSTVRVARSSLAAADLESLAGVTDHRSFSDEGFSLVHFASAADAIAAVERFGSEASALRLAEHSIDNETSAALKTVLAKASGLESLAITECSVEDTHALVTAIAAAPALRELDVSGSGLSDEDLAYLLSFAKCKSTLRVLSVSHNEITEKSGEDLAQFVADSAIEELDISGTNLGAAGIAALCEGIKQTKTLQAFVANDCELGAPGVTTVASGLIMNSSVRTVELDGNDCGDEGAARMAGMLQLNGTVEGISLARNGISDQGAHELAMVLRESKAVRHVNLEQNRIGILGADEIADVFEANQDIMDINLEDQLVTEDEIAAQKEASSERASRRRRQMRKPAPPPGAPESAAAAAVDDDDNDARGEATADAEMAAAEDGSEGDETDEEYMDSDATLSDDEEESNLVRTGYLIMQFILGERGAEVRSWKRRYFTLQKGKLTYYKRDDDPDPEGVIFLENCKVLEGEAFVKRKNAIRIVSKKETYDMYAKNDSEMREWIAALQESVTRTAILRIHLEENTFSSFGMAFNQSSFRSVVVDETQSAATIVQILARKIGIDRPDKYTLYYRDERDGAETMMNPDELVIPVLNKWGLDEKYFKFFIKRKMSSDPMVLKYERMTQQNPNDLNAWKQLATAYYIGEEYDNALDAYSHCTELAPDNISLWLAVAMIHETRNEFQIAKEVYERCLSIDPSNTLAGYNLAKVMERLGFTDLAISIRKQVSNQTRSQREMQQAMSLQQMQMAQFAQMGGSMPNMAQMAQMAQMNQMNQMAAMGSMGQMNPMGNMYGMRAGGSFSGNPMMARAGSAMPGYMAGIGAGAHEHAMSRAATTVPGVNMAGTGGAVAPSRGQASASKFIRFGSQANFAAAAQEAQEAVPKEENPYWAKEKKKKGLFRR